MTKLVEQEDDGCHRIAAADSHCSILLVGEDNPQSADPAHALWPWPRGCAGNRLMGILGLTDDQYRALWRTNLCNPTWSAKAARKRAEHLLEHDPDDSPNWGRIVMLGAKVAGVFGKIFGVKFEPFGSRRLGCAGYTHTMVYLPHPSGRNLLWNDRDNHRRAREVMRVIAPEHFQSVWP